MRKITLGLILCSMVTLCFAGQRPLEGFKYASEKALVAMNGNHRRTLHSTKNNHEPGSFPSRMWKAHAKCYRRTVNTGCH